MRISNFNLFAHGLAVTALVLSAQLFSGAANADAVEPTPAELTLIERHLIPLQGGRNFRDLGGYKTMDGRTVKTGKLFRSGVLHHLTPSDYDVLSNYDIKTVVDFRATEERESEPTHWSAGDVHMMTWDYSMSFGDNGNVLARFADPSLDAAGAEALMAELYRSITDEQTPHYAGMFTTLTNSDDALVFHCSAGKDRTGIAAALLLTALGVDRETVIQDYVLSEVIIGLPEYQSEAPALSETTDERYAYLASMPPEALDALMGTRRVYIETAFEEIGHRYGSVDNYLRDEMGLTPERTQLLKSHFLE